MENTINVPGDRPCVIIPTCQAGEFVTLDGQTRPVIFCGLWGLSVSETLLCVTGHSVNIKSPGCDSISTSKP
jgi:hypothetical protein